VLEGGSFRKEGMAMNGNTPWQLKMFEKTLKKKLKLTHLRRQLQYIAADDTCLMISCGENNGALNYHLRSFGGRWIWAEMEEENIRDIEELLHEPVVKVEQSTCTFPFPDAHFDYVVVVDCHEHLEDPLPFNMEIARITKAGGRVVISVPNGNERKLAVWLKRLLGMSEDIYGHVVIGYEIAEVSTMLEDVGIKPCGSSSYSKFFTELLELCINFAYVKILSKRGNTDNDEEATIVPTTKEQLQSVEKTYKMYSLIYPIFRIISQLDIMLFPTVGYAVVVTGRKE
jgi:SAM-dependent methyltransferase